MQRIDCGDDGGGGGRDDVSDLATDFVDTMQSRASHPRRVLRGFTTTKETRRSQSWRLNEARRLREKREERVRVAGGAVTGKTRDIGKTMVES